MLEDGSRFWANVVITALRDEAGNLEGFSKITRDLTERKRVEDSLQAFARRLQQSNRELEQFASVAAHDLQEPLWKIQAFGDRLGARCGDSLGEQGRDYLTRMRNSATRMRTLINDLLTFSRVTTKAQPFVPVDLAVVAQEFVSDLEGRLQQTGGRVEVGRLFTREAEGGGGHLPRLRPERHLVHHQAGDVRRTGRGHQDARQILAGDRGVSGRRERDVRWHR